MASGAIEIPGQTQLKVYPEHKVDLPATKVVGSRNVLIGRAIAELTKGCTSDADRNNIGTKAANTEIRSVQKIKCRYAKFDTAFFAYTELFHQG